MMTDEIERIKARLERIRIESNNKFPYSLEYVRLLDELVKLQDCRINYLELVTASARYLMFGIK